MGFLVAVAQAFCSIRQVCLTIFAIAALTLQLHAQVESHTALAGGTFSDTSETGQDAQSDQPSAAPPAAVWQYGGFLDAAFLLDFNHPANHLFRSRGTAYKVNEPILNMTAVYLQKNASDSSRWGCN